MSIVCNLPLNELSNDEIESISKNCVKEGMLSSEENLQELISVDRKTVTESGITFEQLSDFFTSFELKCKDVNLIIENEDWHDRIEPLIKIEDGWCLSYSKNLKISLFEHTYFVFVLGWNGAQECPFQNKKLDSKYNGYDYGSEDYYIYCQETEKTMHIGDLLFHQISSHGFFQSLNSKYRVDPKTLISFFNLQPGINYKLATKESKWRPTFSIDWSNRNPFADDPQELMSRSWSNHKWEADDRGDYIFYKRKRDDKHYTEYGIHIKDKNHSYKIITYNDIRHCVIENLQNYIYHDDLRTTTVLVD